MADRIDNYSDLPPTLPTAFAGKLKSERVQDLPVRFSGQVEQQALEISNRLLLNLKAVKEDLLLLKLAGFFTLDDYKGLVTFSDSELSILNSLLSASPSVLTQLADLTTRIEALETP